VFLLVPAHPGSPGERAIKRLLLLLYKNVLLCVLNCRCADDAEADIADPVHMYYVNDGVYGSFNCILYDHVTVEASLLDVSAVVCLHRSLYFDICWSLCI